MASIRTVSKSTVSDSMNTFFISDLHFGHTNILKFTRSDGTPLRPFNSIEEMDETIISNWNSVVRHNDKVIVLGDVVINKKHLPTVSRLNGLKTLVMGNHDAEPPDVYFQWFTKVQAYRTFDGCILSHIPVHPSQFGRFTFNVHGHLHSNYVMMNDERDYRYFNVSVDCDDMGWKPKPWDEIKALLDQRNGG